MSMARVSKSAKSSELRGIDMRALLMLVVA
jgi:hypothetical protein